MQTNAEIQKFAKDRYRAKFPVFGKVNVIESDVSPAWQYLIGKLIKKQILKPLY